MSKQPSREIARDRRVPAEWEPQSCIWIAWPHNRDTWPGLFASIPGFFANWIEVIAESTPVRLIVSAQYASEVHSSIATIKNVDVIDIPTNDCWIRDFGPGFVLSDSDRQLHGINWQYNAWGGKYPPWNLDNAAALKMCRQADLPCVVGNLTLEGGALEFDGRGRLLTTPDCLINPTRNPGLTEQDISNELHRQCGVTEIVWLDGGGLAGDDTDGHIDQLARFVDHENVVASVSDHMDDPSAQGLQQNFRQLELWGQATTPGVHVHRLPIPGPRAIKGQRVPESYCNFLRLGKERMLVPSFNAPEDDYALGLLREISCSDVIAVDCRDLVWGLGALHCASRDQPATRS